ncbi:MAG TPA: ATP-binding cassette domain-containing protein [Ferruginibacter sp.]|nr:ATP-binding cassette domain-containing protein [Ferruginibacter sp.]
MLAAVNIHKKYDDLEILKGVDININQGEIVSIVGPSGSGKSTLLHILGTLDEADQGHLDISGVRISSRLPLKLEPVKWYRRLLNCLLDFIFIQLLAIGVFYLFYHSVSDLSLIIQLRSYWLIIICTLYLYYFLFEMLTGRTLAKFITQTKVVSKRDGSRPDLRTATLRTITRFLPFGYFEAVSFFSARPTGWHDDISDTLVVDSSFQFQKRNTAYLSGKKLAAFRNTHIGFVFQFHHLLPEFTALENVCIPGWVAGRQKKEVMDRALALLKTLGLSERLENKPNELSGGEQQRVAVARALINDPSIVLADEPTGNLDSSNARELHQLFIDLRNQLNQTFLIVTHNEELARMSDRILQMRDGRIIEN